MNQTLTLKDIPRVKAGCTAKTTMRELSEVDQERLYLATRAKDLLGYSGLVADVTGEMAVPKLGPLAEALNVLDIQTLDLSTVIEYQMQEMVRATREKILGGSLRDWATGYFSEAGWAKTSLESYEHPIPEFVLEKAIRLKEKLPEVTFHIQHMRDPKADPFLVASIAREIYYVEAWDEPRFEGRRSTRDSDLSF